MVEGGLKVFGFDMPAHWAYRVEDVVGYSFTVEVRLQL